MADVYDSNEHRARLSQLMNEPAHWRALYDEDSPWPADVADFIGRLKLLYGVPFKYLVPDSRMLPRESIRFFYVDNNWTGALADGVRSIGRIAEIDIQHDAAITEQVNTEADLAAMNLRRDRLGKEAAQATPQRPQYAGFLMRSAVVSGWPGLEIQAFADVAGTQPVDMLRMDRLAPDVLLCLFAQRFEKLNVHEPKEGITFGAEPHFQTEDTTEPKKYTKQLRGLGIGNYTVGEPIENCEVDVPLRDGGQRVVRMAELKSAMLEKLTSLKPPAWDKSKEFTAAQFTLQMVQGADQHWFLGSDKLPSEADEANGRSWPTDTRDQDRKALINFLFEN